MVYERERLSMQSLCPHMLNPHFTLNVGGGNINGSLGSISKKTWCTVRCVSYLQPVCPHQLLCGGSSMRHGDAVVAGDQYRGTGQDVRGHQTRRHGAKVGVKRGGCSGIHVGGEAGRDWEHGLQGQKKTEIDRVFHIYHICRNKWELLDNTLSPIMKTGDRDCGDINRQMNNYWHQEKTKNFTLFFFSYNFQRKSHTSRFNKKVEH